MTERPEAIRCQSPEAACLHPASRSGDEHSDGSQRHGIKEEVHPLVVAVCLSFNYPPRLSVSQLLSLSVIFPTLTNVWLSVAFTLLIRHKVIRWRQRVPLQKCSFLDNNVVVWCLWDQWKGEFFLFLPWDQVGCFYSNIQDPIGTLCALVGWWTYVGPLPQYLKYDLIILNLTPTLPRLFIILTLTHKICVNAFLMQSRQQTQINDHVSALWPLSAFTLPGRKWHIFIDKQQYWKNVLNIMKSL